MRGGPFRKKGHQRYCKLMGLTMLSVALHSPLWRLSMSKPPQTRPLYCHFWAKTSQYLAEACYVFHSGLANSAALSAGSCCRPHDYLPRRLHMCHDGPTRGFDFSAAITSAGVAGVSTATASTAAVRLRAQRCCPCPHCCFLRCLCHKFWLLLLPLLPSKTRLFELF